MKKPFINLLAIALSVAACGGCRPGAAARLSPPMAVTITEVNFVEGRSMEKGAPLFRLDGRTAAVAGPIAGQTLVRQKKILYGGGSTPSQSNLR